MKTKNYNLGSFRFWIMIFQVFRVLQINLYQISPVAEKFDINLPECILR